MRFLQKWKKSREIKEKEKETFTHNIVEELNKKLNKSSDSEISESEPELNQSSFKDVYDFHKGNLLQIKNYFY